MPAGPPLLPDPGGVPPTAGGTGTLAPVVLQRGTAQLAAEALIPVAVIALVPFGIVVAARDGVDLTDGLLTNILFGYLVASVLSLLWVGRERVELTAAGIRIVRRVGSTELAWWEIRGVTVRRHFGQSFIQLAGPDGDAQVFAPNSGVAFFKDRAFESKVATIESWWRTNRSHIPSLGIRPHPNSPF